MKRPATGLILVGGRSSRMGRPKAWLDFGGEPLLARVARIVGSVCREVLVAAAPGQELPRTPARVVVDEHPGLGPLSGLEVGLREAAYDAVFVAPCDVPFLRPEVVERLLDRAQDVDVVVLSDGGHLHPLVAVYRRGLLARVRELLAAGRLRPVFLLEQARARVLAREDCADIDGDLESWENLNGPEDYRRALGTRVEVELVGLARHATGRARVAVRVPPDGRLGEVVAALAERLPALVGDVIAPDRRTLTDGHAFCSAEAGLLGHPGDPIPGGRLTLLTLPSGG